jgi:hypothetical protein
VNNEANTSPIDRSLALGKGNVMSYEDREAARTERAAKEKAKVAGTGQRKSC